MSYTTKILYPEGIVDLDVKAGEYVGKGELLGYNSGWVLASTSSGYYANYVAMNDSPGGTKIQACKKCLLFDEDAPYTANTAQYLSTAGGITETRPTGSGYMIQKVGGSLDTARCLIDIKEPQEFEMFIKPDTYDATTEAGLGATDAGWAGPSIDAQHEYVFFTGRLPSGLIGSGPVIARVLYDNIGATVIDMDVTVVGAYDGGSNVQDTGTAITAGDINVDTDNLICYQDVSACFDTDFYKASRSFALQLHLDAITSGDLLVVGLYIRGWKV